MTYSLPQPWHHEPDGSWTHIAIPNVRLRIRERGGIKIVTRGGIVLTRDPVDLDQAKRFVEAIALAGAEGMPR